MSEIVAIVGSRSFRDYARVMTYVYGLPAGTKVISGGCPDSPDAWAISAAETMGFDTQEYLPADYPGSTFGQKCYERNRDIASAGTRCVAFWDGESPGTKMTIQFFDRKGKPVEIIYPQSEFYISPKEEARILFVTTIAESGGECVKELIQAAFEDAGFTDAQFRYTLHELQNTCIVAGRLDDDGITELARLTPPVDLPSQPVDLTQPEPLASPVDNLPDWVKNGIPEDCKLLTQFTNREVRLTQEVIADFRANRTRSREECRNWQWNGDNSVVTVRHFKPCLQKVVVEHYSFKDDCFVDGSPKESPNQEICACLNQKYNPQVPCKHTIERERRLQEEEGL